MPDLKHLFWRLWNALHGHGYSMRWYTDTTGRSYRSLTPWRGTCPRPLTNDWSAKACVKAGNCGCDEREKQ